MLSTTKQAEGVHITGVVDLPKHARSCHAFSVPGESLPGQFRELGIVIEVIVRVWTGEEI